MRSDYQERKTARVARLRKRANAAGTEAKQAGEAAEAVASQIPLGQPILVGHHSEKRHRRDIDRIDRNMRKSVEAGKRQEELHRRADVAEENTAISSDDPKALSKLRARVEELEKTQQHMKQVNAAYRKGDAALIALGLSPETIAELREQVAKGYSWEKSPYPSYSLTNNNANIRRLRERIKRLEAQETIPHQEWPFDGGRLVADPTENRVQLFFDEKPPKDQCKALARSGFKFAKSISAWQRQYSTYAIHLARGFAGLPAEEARATETAASDDPQPEVEEVDQTAPVVDTPDDSESLPEAGENPEAEQEAIPEETNPVTPTEDAPEPVQDIAENVVDEAAPPDEHEPPQSASEGEDVGEEEPPAREIDGERCGTEESAPATPDTLDPVDVPAPIDTPDPVNAADASDTPEIPDNPAVPANIVAPTTSGNLDAPAAQANPPSSPVAELAFTGGRLVIEPAENRVRLFYDENPSRKTLGVLKGGEFLYIRSIKGWQRDYSDAAIQWAKAHVGLPVGNAPGEGSIPATGPTVPAVAVAAPEEKGKVCARCGREADANNPLRRIVFQDENGNDTDRELDACYSCFGLYVTEQGLARAQ